MILQIRRGVFETNSSSSHSISICEAAPMVYDLPVTANKKVRVRCGEFGWGVYSFSDSETKLSYLVTALCQGIPFIEKGAELPVFEEYISNSPHYSHYNRLVNVIKECCDATLEIVPGNDEFYPYGYIDHQSSSVAFDEVLNKGELHICKFLFCAHSILKIDNDNH
jgi:hypothetical protein